DGGAGTDSFEVIGTDAAEKYVVQTDSSPGQPVQMVGDTQTVTQLGGFGGMVVDNQHQRVFVSGGSGNDRLAIFDFDGNRIGTRADEPGASSMIIDGNTLYVAAKNV